MAPQNASTNPLPSKWSYRRGIKDLHDESCIECEQKKEGDFVECESVILLPKFGDQARCPRQCHISCAQQKWPVSDQNWYCGFCSHCVTCEGDIVFNVSTPSTTLVCYSCTLFEHIHCAETRHPRETRRWTPTCCLCGAFLHTASEQKLVTSATPSTAATASSIPAIALPTSANSHHQGNNDAVVEDDAEAEANNDDDDNDNMNEDEDRND